MYPRVLQELSNDLLLYGRCHWYEYDSPNRFVIERMCPYGY